VATINPNQDYDIIHTLTFSEASGTCPIKLYRGSSSTDTGTVYYRAGTSGDWTSLSVSGTDTTFPVTDTTMQVAHNWNKSGNNYMTPSFLDATNITSISISQKSSLTGTMGNYFMAAYAEGCSSLTSLDVPDTSGLISVGDVFMGSYANNCSKLTSLDVPDTSSLESVGTNFMSFYAFGCSKLTSLNVPDTSSLESVGDWFMNSYAFGCSKLTSLAVPDTSSLGSVGNYFMNSYAGGCSSLTELVLPAVGWFEDNNVNWSVPSSRLGVLKGRVLNRADLSGWRALTAEGKTLHTNYIRDPDLVYMASKIKIYKGTVTAGGTDGTLISSGTGLNPIESGAIKVPESGYAEGNWIKLAVRCDTGYETVEDASRHARISIEDSAKVTMWQLAPDNNGQPGTAEDWGEPLDILTKIGATNTIFWARARVASTEEPANDKSVYIQVAATIGATS
jgi:hypothetical protein